MFRSSGSTGSRHLRASQHPGTAGAPKLARSWRFSPEKQSAWMGGNSLALRRSRCFYHYFGESQVICVLPRCVTRELCPQGYLTTTPSSPTKAQGKGVQPQEVQS